MSSADGIQTRKMSYYLEVFPMHSAQCTPNLILNFGKTTCFLHVIICNERREMDDIAIKPGSPQNGACTFSEFRGKVHFFLVSSQFCARFFDLNSRSVCLIAELLSHTRPTCLARQRTPGKCPNFVRKSRRRILYLDQSNFVLFSI